MTELPRWEDNPIRNLDRDEAIRRLSAIWGYCNGYGDAVGVDIQTMVDKGRWATPGEIKEKSS